MNTTFIRKSTTCFPLLAAATVLLAACGQYGDLYLPEDVDTGQSQQQQVDEPQDREEAQGPDQEQEQEPEQPQNP